MVARNMMKTMGMLCLCLLLVGSGAVAANEPSWPQEITVDGNRIVIHQPQMDEWRNYTRLKARMVVEITPSGAREPILGALWLSADTDTDMDARVVKLSNLTVEHANFPALDEQESAQMIQVLQKSLTENVREVSVDRILANLKRTRESDRSFQGSSEPPKIFVSESPAILVQFDGDPILYPIEGTRLKFAVNTNWDLLVHEADKTYYLLNGDQWLTTKDFRRGPWTEPATLPSDFSRIPDDENWADLRGHLTVKKDIASSIPTVLISTKPAELIVTHGKPELTKIEGTELSYVSNSDQHLFFCDGDRSYYYLVSGRWFKTTNLLRGNWKAVKGDLPKDFARLPADESLEGVLASVPGTPQAEEALIQAAIPQKALVKRNEARLTVEYIGEPKFAPIEGTSLRYAVNTSYDVIQVGAKYYACVNGVWFVSISPMGPWVVADAVPDPIYAIPPSSPVYRTTYVYVYDVTDDVVEFGYTSGYLGCYPWYGTVVYGTGYYYRPYIFWRGVRPIFWPRPYTYGCAAYYNPYVGAFVRAGVFYGPYRGIGRGAVYVPGTGTYARGVAVWGPHNAAWAGVAYTPATGWIAGGGSTMGHRPPGPPISPYARWGKAAVPAAGAIGAMGFGHRWNALRDAGRVHPGRGKWDALKRPGKIRPPRGTLEALGERGRGRALRDRVPLTGRRKRDDLYVGRDGNIYKRGGKGRWEQYTRDRNWKPVTETRGRPPLDGMRGGVGQGHLKKPLDRNYYRKGFETSAPGSNASKIKMPPGKDSIGIEYNSRDRNNNVPNRIESDVSNSNVKTTGRNRSISREYNSRDRNNNVPNRIESDVSNSNVKTTGRNRSISRDYNSRDRNNNVPNRIESDVSNSNVKTTGRNRSISRDYNSRDKNNNVPNRIESDVNNSNAGKPSKNGSISREYSSRDKNNNAPNRIESDVNNSNVKTPRRNGSISRDYNSRDRNNNAPNRIESDVNNSNAGRPSKNGCGKYRRDRREAGAKAG